MTTQSTLSLLIYISNFYNLNGIEPRIDQEHFNLEPTCGVKPQKLGYRISNSKESGEVYPWTVLVQRRAKKAGHPHAQALCGGSIITRK